jgi:hypothetical protein
MKDGILREFSCPIMELNVIPHSRVLYSRSLIENKVIPFAHNLLGELNPNLEERLYIYYPNVAFLINKVYITHTKDDSRVTVWLDCSVLDTPCGRLLNKAIEEDLDIQFSLRALANSTKLEGFEIVHEDWFDFITIDAYVKDKRLYED